MSSIFHRVDAHDCVEPSKIRLGIRRQFRQAIAFAVIASPEQMIEQITVRFGRNGSGNFHNPSDLLVDRRYLSVDRGEHRPPFKRPAQYFVTIPGVIGDRGDSACFPIFQSYGIKCGGAGEREAFLEVAKACVVRGNGIQEMR